MVIVLFLLNKFRCPLPSRCEGKAVQPAPVAPVKALPEFPTIGVTGQVGGVDVTGALLVGAVHVFTLLNKFRCPPCHSQPSTDVVANP